MTKQELIKHLELEEKLWMHHIGYLGRISHILAVSPLLEHDHNNFLSSASMMVEILRNLIEKEKESES